MQMDSLPGTRLTGDEFGEETRVVDGVDAPFPEAKFIGHRIGPDLGRVEGFSSTVGNLKAGLAKRVRPLPFTPSKSSWWRTSASLETLFSVRSSLVRRYGNGGSWTLSFKVENRGLLRGLGSHSRKLLQKRSRPSLMASRWSLTRSSRQRGRRHDQSSRRVIKE